MYIESGKKKLSLKPFFKTLFQPHVPHYKTNLCDCNTYEIQFEKERIMSTFPITDSTYYLTRM